MKTHELTSIDLYNHWILDIWDSGLIGAPRPLSEWTVYEIYAECLEHGMGEGEIGEVYGLSEQVLIDGILVAEYWYTDSEWFAKEYREEGVSEVNSIETFINFESK